MSSGGYEDDAFKKLLSDLKPYAKLLPKDSDIRHRVTLWVKKLLCTSEQKELRNAYCKLLLQMLKEGNVAGVFKEIPPIGPLKPLPSNISNNKSLQSPKKSRLLQPGWARRSHPFRLQSPEYDRKSGDDFEDIHDEELYEGDMHSSPSLSLEDLVGVSDPYTGYSHVRGMDSGKMAGNRKITFDLDSSLEDLQDPKHDLKTSPPLGYWDTDDEDNDSDVTALLQNSSNLDNFTEDRAFQQMLRPKSSPSHSPEQSWARQSAGNASHRTPTRPANTFGALKQEQSQEGARWQYSSCPTSPIKSSSGVNNSMSRSIGSRNKGAEARINMAESKFYEEKAKMQQKLEQTIRQLLDRKNNELEDLKSTNQVHVHKLESQVKSLERQVGQLQRECSHLQGELQRKENDHKLSSQQQKFTLQSEIQQKLLESKEIFDQDKLAMEQKHSQQLQKIQHESSARITKLENSYKSQLATSAEVIRELEGRLSESSRQEAACSEAYSRLAQEKVTLEGTMESMRHELSAANERLSQLEGECMAVEREKNEALELQQRRTDDVIVQFKKQLKQQDSQWNKQLKEMEKKLAVNRQSTEEMEKTHKKELVEQEGLYKRKLQDERRKHSQKTQSLEQVMEKQEKESAARVKKLELTVKDYSVRMEELRTTQKVKVQQAERALEECKKESKSKLDGMVSQLRCEIDKLERDLCTVRSEKDLLKEEFARQTEEKQKIHDKEVEKVQNRHQHDLMQLNRDHRWEVERLTAQHKLDKGNLEKDLGYQLEQKEREWQEQLKEYARENEGLEAQVQKFSDKLHEVKASARKELADATVKWEEERLEMLQQQENVVTKLKVQFEEQCSKERREHREEVDGLKDKAAVQLKHLEAQYSSRVAQVTESTETFKQQTSSLEAELQRVQESHERQVKEIEAYHREEMLSVRAHNEALNKATQQEADSAQKALRKLEDKLQEAKLQHSEKMSHLKLTYEARMRGLLPQNVQRDYENTISSLREQVKIANQRSSLLQQDLSSHNLSPRHNSSSFYSARTPTK